MLERVPATWPATVRSSCRWLARLVRGTQLPTSRSTDGSRRERRHRGSLSADDIIKGAFDAAQGMSLDKLSMPGLAQHLGVGVTSIYWYFRKKEDLLNAMTDVAVDTVVRELPLMADDKPWQEVLYNH